MREQVIAKRYARALFAIGQEAGDEELQNLGEELKALAELLEANPELLRIFKNPIIKTEAKKSMIKQLLENAEASKTVYNFCLYLADKGRLANFPAIQEYYSLLLDEHQGILRGKLTTAIELAKAKKDKIKSELEKQFAQTLFLDYETNKEILGGLVLQVGDKIYDASLKAQLAQMKENIKRGV